MTQFRHTIQHHHLYMQAPVRLSHINLYHCDLPKSEIFPGHPYAKIIFVQKGIGQLHYGNLHTFVHPGSLLLLNPEREKFSIQIDENPLDLAVLGIENLCFSKGQDVLSSPFVMHDGAEETYSLFINKIVDEVQNKAPSFEDACTHYMELLLISIQRNSEIICTSFLEDKTGKDCENIKDYLDTHYAENITLDTLSEQSGMNKYYLVHSFTRKYIRSPISYLNEKRIDESKKLLENTDYSIAEISKLIGFSSQSYFSQAFKKKTLMTPNEYRHSTRSKL